jgi:hypothetical protein
MNKSEVNEELKIDLQNKFQKEFPYNQDLNKLCLYNNKKEKENENECSLNNININNIIKKRLSINKNMKNNINDEINKNKNVNKKGQSRNNDNRNKIKYKSLSNRHKINPKDVSIRLYNMHQIIIDKLNKKKLEIEQQEMKNCSFIPKINNKSKKIIEMLEYKNKNILFRNEEETMPKAISYNNINATLIELKPKYNKSFNHFNNKIINEQELYTGSNFASKKQSNNEPEELKQYAYKAKNNNTNKMHNEKNINNYRNKKKNIKYKYKYNTMHLAKEKDILLTNENTNKNKPSNIKQLYSIITNEDYKQDIKNIENLNTKENIYNIKINNNNSNNNNNNNNSRKKIKYNYFNTKNEIPKPNEYNKYRDSSKILYTEENSNSNYNKNNNLYCDSNYNYIYRRRAMSSSPKNENNKINEIILKKKDNKKNLNSKSFINKYYNENDNCTFKPCIYKNKKYINKPSHYGSNEELLSKIHEDMRKKNAKIEFLRKIQEKKEMSECIFRPKINRAVCNFDINNNNKNKINKVRRGQSSSYLNQMKLKMDKKKVEERNKKYLPNEDIFRIPNTFNYNTYQNYLNINKCFNNNNNNNNVYVKKNISRNHSYTNRKNHYTLNENEIINNRMVINKIIKEQ